MELALFPIAAILILLSGSVTPAHLADGPGSPATLLRRLFIPGPGRAVTEQRLHSQSSFKAEYNQQAPASPAEAADCLITSQVRLAYQLASRPVYRTRFGIRSRAYLATAPPLA